MSSLKSMRSSSDKVLVNPCSTKGEDIYRAFRHWSRSGQRLRETRTHSATSMHPERLISFPEATGSCIEKGNIIVGIGTHGEEGG